MTALRVSEISAASPDMSEEQFARFVADIKANGQLVPIWVRGDEVIDGRKRLAACQQLGIIPKTIDVSPGQDIEAVGRSLNALRTHYTKSQLALYAKEKMVTATRGTSGNILKNKGVPVVTTEDAARELGISESQIQLAGRVLRTASPDVIDAVRRGKATLHQAKPGKRKASISMAGRKVQKAPPLTSQWNEFLNQAEFAADNLEASAERAAQLESSAKWAERLRSVRSTLSTVIRILEEA